MRYIVFRSFLFVNMASSFKIDMSIIYSVNIAFNVFVICAVSAHFLFASVFKLVTKVLGFSIKLCHYMIVPFTDLAISSFREMI